MRDSMIFYRSFYEAINELPLENQGEIYSAIFDYSLNFNEPNLTGLSKTIFTLIKPQLDANNKRFENGKKGGRKKANVNQNRTKSKPKVNQKETKDEANNNVNVNNNVNSNDNNNKEKKEIFNFRKSLINLGFEELLVKDWLKVRKDKNASNTQTAFSAIENQVNDTQLNINEVLKVHVEKSWAGFKIKWYENELQKNKQNGQQVSNTKQAATYNRSEAINSLQTKFGGGH